jgi:phage-related protein
MALKVGDLYVSLTANTQKLQGQLNGAARQVERFGRQMKSLGKDASEMSNMVVGAMAAVFAAATSKDAKNLEVKKQLEELKTQSVALASEIAQAAMPMFQQMTDFVGRLITAFRELSPAQRKLLVSFLQGAMAVSAIGIAAVKLEPAFKLAGSAISFAGTAMSALGTAVAWVQGALASLGVGFLPVLAGIAAFIFIAGFVRQAWAENLGGIQEKFATVWGWISEKGGVVSKFLGQAADFIGERFKAVFSEIWDRYRTFMQLIIRGAALLARSLGMEDVFDVNGLEKAALQFTDQYPKLMLEGAKVLGEAAVEGVKVIGSGLGTALEFSGSGLSKIAGDVKAKLSGAFKGLLPEAAKVPITLSADKAEKEKTKAADPVKVDYGRLRADKMEASFVALAGIGGNLRDSLEMSGALNVPKELEQFSGNALKSVKGIEDVRDFLHKIGASAGEAEKYLSAWERWNEDQKKNAAHVDRLRADRTPQAAQKFLGGGSLGEAARMAGITTGIPPEFESFSGGLLKTAADFEDLRDRLAQVREKNPLLDQFIDQMQAVQEEAGKKAKELEEARKQAVSGFVDGVVGSMGKVGGVIQAATGPLAQAGGPIGALVAVGFELLKNSKQFGEFQAAMDGVIQGLSDALGQLLPPFTMLVSAIQPIVAAVGAIVANVVPLLTAVLEPLLPVFVILGALLMTLSPIIGAIVQVLQVALIPIMGVLNGVMRALFGAIQVVAYVILGYVVLYGELWNGIISAVQAVLTFLSAIEIAGAKPFAFLAEWSASLESSKAATDTYRQQMNDVGSMTFDAAMETAKGLGTLGEATDQLAGSMTNAASGFKVDLARFNATNVGAGPRSPADLGVGSGALVGDTYVTIVSNDPEVIWERMQGVNRRKAFQLGRGPLGGLPAFGG